jgi:hypothetical protein
MSFAHYMNIEVFENILGCIQGAVRIVITANDYYVFATCFNQLPKEFIVLGKCLMSGVGCIKNVSGYNKQLNFMVVDSPKEPVKKKVMFIEAVVVM